MGMFMSGVLFILFVLFLVGYWLYCLTDAALTPAAEFRGLPKSGWITLIAATFMLGALAWVIARACLRTTRWSRASYGHLALAGRGRPAVRRHPHQPVSTDASQVTEALSRHPAGRSKDQGRPVRAVPIGPDDDPEFLRQLAERIRGER